MINPHYTPITTIPPPATVRQRQRLRQFDEDPYQGICDLMLSEAYQSVPDHYLDVEHPEHAPDLLSHHVRLQIERTLIDLINNCDTGTQYELYIRALRNRYAGIGS